jgi:hypothetical protein
MRSWDLIQMIGVNTHMTYNDGAYAKIDNVIQDLKFLGVSYVRDVIPGNEGVPQLVGREALRRMIHESIKLNIFFSSGWNAESVSWLSTLEKAVPGAVASIEGYNEINNFPVVYEHQTGPVAAKNGQQALYAAVKSDPYLKHVPVIDMTGFEMIKEPRFQYGETLNGFADLMNVHAYSQNGAQPRYWINPAPPQGYKSVAADRPKAITEFGYSSQPQSGWGFIGVDERSQAKGILNGIFDAARSGFEKLYIYELLDEKPDPEMKELQFHFGLFTFDNEPKAAAKAIRNLTSVFADSDEGPNPSSPDPMFRVSIDAPQSDPIYSLVLTKGNGNRLVAIWREPEFWDRASGHPLDEKPIQTKVSLGKDCETIRLFDVLVSDRPVAVGSGKSFSLALGDHVQVLECT